LTVENERGACEGFVEYNRCKSGVGSKGSSAKREGRDFRGHSEGGHGRLRETRFFDLIANGLDESSQLMPDHMSA